MAALASNDRHNVFKWYTTRYANDNEFIYAGPLNVIQFSPLSLSRYLLQVTTFPPHFQDYGQVMTLQYWGEKPNFGPGIYHKLLSFRLPLLTLRQRNPIQNLPIDDFGRRNLVAFRRFYDSHMAQHAPQQARNIDVAKGSDYNQHYYARHQRLPQGYSLPMFLNIKAACVIFRAPADITRILNPRQVDLQRTNETFEQLMERLCGLYQPNLRPDDSSDDSGPDDGADGDDDDDYLDTSDDVRDYLMSLYTTRAPVIRNMSATNQRLIMNIFNNLTFPVQGRGIPRETLDQRFTRDWLPELEREVRKTVEKVIRRQMLAYIEHLRTNRS